MPEKTVTIFGNSKAEPQSPLYKLAFEIGACLAQNGFAIANGGYGGTMLAGAQGASQNDGKTIGVTCSQFKSKPNQYVQQQVSTKNLDERLDKLIELGDAFVVLPGRTGTLLELAKVWEFQNKGFHKTVKPIILASDFWNPLVDIMSSIDKNLRKEINLITEPEKISEFLINYFQ
jgi:hypothetical protein